MVNKIMLTFVGTNFLFLVGGALLVAFSVVSRNDMKQATTMSNVANNLLLSKSPITGSSPQNSQAPKGRSCHDANNSASDPCQRHLRVRDVPLGAPGIHTPAQSRLPQSPWLAHRHMHDFHYDTRPDSVVRYFENQGPAQHPVGRAADSRPILVTDEVRLLRIRQQHEPALRPGRDMPIGFNSRSQVRMSDALYELLKSLLGSHLYRCVWYCWYVQNTFSSNYTK